MMESMAMNNVALAALLYETLPALASPTVYGTSSMIRVFTLSILGIGGLALLILSCCCQCIRDFHSATMGSYSVSMEEDHRRPLSPARRPQSRATLSWCSVSMEEDDRSPQYLGYEREFQSGSVMCRILLVMVLLATLAALVVGAVQLLVWLVHMCGAIHVPIWLADFWDSATAWVIRAWNSPPAWVIHAWKSSTAWVIHAWNSMETPVLLVLGISFALLTLLYGGLWVTGFVNYGIALGSSAAMWMSCIGNVVAGSLFSLLQMIAMGGVSVCTVLLYIVPVVALVVGAFEIFRWLVPSGAIHVPTWLMDSWDSTTAWVLHVWDSFEIFGWWNSFVAWLHNLGASITDHHKWKIYT